MDPSEHTAAAGTLLGRLAEASREGAEAEGELRMPVLAALGMLHIVPAVADKVMHAALEVRRPVGSLPTEHSCDCGA